MFLITHLNISTGYQGLGWAESELHKNFVFYTTTTLHQNGGFIFFKYLKFLDTTKCANEGGHSNWWSNTDPVETYLMPLLHTVHTPMPNTTHSHITHTHSYPHNPTQPPHPQAPHTPAHT